MEYNIEGLYVTHQRLVKSTKMDFIRYLYNEINWDNEMIGIKGARGVGKTTMMLQHVKEVFGESAQALYVSLDNFFFSTHTLSEVVEYHYLHGGTHLFIDEIHHYENWQTLLKNICDEYPGLHVVYTGSSMLQIDYTQGDLSRRQIVYELRGMSFREFLEFEGVCGISPVPLEALLADHVTIASELSSKIKVLPYFEKYLKMGYYPFYKKDVKGFDYRVQAVVKEVLHEDLPAVEDVSFNTVVKTQRMLMILAEKVPQTPVLSDLYRLLDTTRDSGIKMLYNLERAGLLSLVTSEKKNLKALVKPDKILLNNPSLMCALTYRADKGTLRETFFYNQLSAVSEVSYPKQGDFLVDRKFLFEVGGRGKSFDQIKDVPDSFLALDDMEMGHHNRIPLWMFGLLY